MKNIRILFLISCFAALIVGCGQQQPANVPKLEPVNITIVNDGKPIDGVLVGLGWQGEPGNWTAAGLTNSSGVARIFTSSGSWRGPGAPAGEYKVMLSKEPKLEPLLSPDEMRQLETDPVAFERHQASEARRLAEAPREIPARYNLLSNTPLVLSVESGTGASQTYDVSQ